MHIALYSYFGRNSYFCQCGTIFEQSPENVFRYEQVISDNCHIFIYRFGFI